MAEPVNVYIFLNIIKKQIDRIFAGDDDSNAYEKPFVDIYSIAEKIGIKVLLVPAVTINNKRAMMRKIGNNFVIYVNKDDSEEEQRFSIAHEIAHVILMRIKPPTVFHYLTTSNQEMPTKTRLFVDHQLETIGKQNSEDNEIITEKKLETVCNMIAQVASDTLGKAVSEKTAHAVYDKVLEAYSMIYLKAIHNDEIKKIIYKAIEETIEEEIADYFAANLLVPTERFLLWEDKPLEEIASVFKVNVDCIKKRKDQEIENEIFYLRPVNLSSDIKVKNKPPLSLDEMRHLLGGSSAAGQT